MRRAGLQARAGQLTRIADMDGDRGAGRQPLAVGGAQGDLVVAHRQLGRVDHGARAQRAVLVAPHDVGRGDAVILQVAHRAAQVDQLAPGHLGAAGRVGDGYAGGLVGDLHRRRVAGAGLDAVAGHHPEDQRPAAQQVGVKGPALAGQVQRQGLEAGAAVPTAQHVVLQRSAIRVAGLPVQRLRAGDRGSAADHADITDLGGVGADLLLGPHAVIGQAHDLQAGGAGGEGHRQPEAQQVGELLVGLGGEGVLGQGLRLAVEQAQGVAARHLGAERAAGQALQVVQVGHLLLRQQRAVDAQHVVGLEARHACGALVVVPLVDPVVQPKVGVIADPLVIAVAHHIAPDAAAERLARNAEVGVAKVEAPVAAGADGRPTVGEAAIIGRLPAGGRAGRRVLAAQRVAHLVGAVPVGVRAVEIPGARAAAGGARWPGGQAPAPPAAPPVGLGAEQRKVDVGVPVVVEVLFLPAFHLAEQVVGGAQVALVAGQVLALGSGLVQPADQGRHRQVDAVRVEAGGERAVGGRVAVHRVGAADPAVGLVDVFAPAREVGHVVDVVADDVEAHVQARRGQHGEGRADQAVIVGVALDG